MMSGEEPTLSRLGIVERFKVGDRGQVEESLDQLHACHIQHLRLHLSWAEYCSAGGDTWYDWLLPTLAREVEVLACIHETPPHLSETGRINAPPKRLHALADFVDHLVTRHRNSLDAVELWSEPNNVQHWDRSADPDWLKFCTMIAAAAHSGREHGIKTLLSGPCGNALDWFRLMGCRGVLGAVEGVALSGFSEEDLSAVNWVGWAALIQSLRAQMEGFNSKLEVWIAEAGQYCSRYDQYAQVRALCNALQAPAERLYWCTLKDAEFDPSRRSGVRADDRRCHCGIYTFAGRPKLLARLLASGKLKLCVPSASFLGRPAVTGVQPILVTGGAGFIGSNLADRLATDGHHVLIYDALARPGVEDNVIWLREQHPRRISIAIADTRDRPAMESAAANALAVFHLAGQVAVTTSLSDPLDDFETNIGGTLALLEGLRKRRQPPPIIFASTNKVYGDLRAIALEREGDAYLPIDIALRQSGIDESQPLDFHTPYGCSKGAADQYVLDYSRSLGVPGVVLRMSCIYGRRQQGSEDQGWVAHFMLRILAGKPITIYGDGRQVRDILWVDDAVTAYIAAWRRIDAVRGQAFNLGGGRENAVSLIQVIREAEKIVGRPVEYRFDNWRAGDQRYFVTDRRHVSEALNLAEPVPWRRGLRMLADALAREGEPASSLPGPAGLMVGAHT